MRLSWYADTGVAVFSIWQGGTCTGTFRLPIADLPRMIETLQRGPRTDDDPRAAELHDMPRQRGRTGHGAGRASGQYGPGDYGPGPEPDTGYSDPGFPAAAAAGTEGYGRTGAHGRYEETRAVYPDEGLPTGHGGYREDRYGDEPPTGVYRGDLLDEDTGTGRRPARHGGRQDDPLPAGYPDDLHDGGGHHDDPLSGGYADERRGGPYRANSLTGGYRADLHGGHHDDPLPASYADEPRGGGRRADRHGDDYPDDPLTRGYHEERYAGGYSGDPHGGYAEEPVTARYQEEPPTGDYPTGPADPASDDPDYPATAGNAGYSPARPYVASVPSGPPGTGEGRGRRHGSDQEESDPSPGPFPYGRPPAEPEVRGRRR